MVLHGLDVITRLGRRALELVCAATLFALMLLTAADVAGRGLLNRPVLGSFQLTQVALAVMIFIGLPLVTARNEHLRAGLIDHLFSDRFNRLRQPLIDFISFAALAGLSWRLWIQAAANRANGEVLSVIELPLWILVYLMAACASIATVIVGVIALEGIAGRAKNTSAKE